MPGPPPCFFPASGSALASGPPSSVRGASSVTVGVLVGGGGAPASSTAASFLGQPITSTGTKAVNARNVRVRRIDERILGGFLLTSEPTAFVEEPRNFRRKLAPLDRV